MNFIERSQEHYKRLPRHNILHQKKVGVEHPPPRLDQPKQRLTKLKNQQQCFLSSLYVPKQQCLYVLLCLYNPAKLHLDMYNPLASIPPSTCNLPAVSFKKDILQQKLVRHLDTPFESQVLCNLGAIALIFQASCRCKDLTLMIAEHKAEPHPFTNLYRGIKICIDHSLWRWL